jgi:hypothetical protein
MTTQQYQQKLEAIRIKREATIDKALQDSMRALKNLKYEYLVTNKNYSIGDLVITNDNIPREITQIVVKQRYCTSQYEELFYKTTCLNKKTLEPLANQPSDPFIGEIDIACQLNLNKINNK